MTLETVKSDVIQAIEAKFGRLDRRIDELEAAADRNFTGGRESKSIGRLVIENAEFKAFAERPRKGAVEVPVKTFFPGELKTTITSTAVGSSTPGILVPSRVPGIVKPGVRRNRVRDLIPRFTTSNNAVEFVKENVFTSNASPQVEGSAKQESALTFTIDYENVRTIAHWIPASRQILDDLPQLQAYIEQRLIDGLMDEEDKQILSGDGTGQNLSGLINEATAYNSGTYGQTGDTKVDKVLRMATQIRAQNLEASGVIMHPTDWDLVQSQKEDQPSAGSGQYLLGFGGPRGTAEPTLWGLPVATTTAMTAGTCLVGAFATHVALWDRLQAQVVISTEHSDFFTKNLVAIRAEERLALTTYRSDAVVYCSSF